MALIGIEINEIIFTDGVGAAFNCNSSGALGYQYQFMVGDGAGRDMPSGIGLPVNDIFHLGEQGVFHGDAHSFPGYSLSKPICGVRVRQKAVGTKDVVAF